MPVPSNIKEISLWKTKFFKNISENGGSQNYAISLAKSDELVIHSQTQKNGRLWGIITPVQFLKLIEKNKGLYEVITKYPHKVYLDIDEKHIDNFEVYIDKVKNVVNTYFPDADMAISGSHTLEKTSLHIILNNYQIHNETERTQIKVLIKYISENVLNSFDCKVYTNNRNMKCINQSKLDGRVQSILENPDLKKHIITAFFNLSCLPFPTLPEDIQDEIMIEKSKQTFNLAELPKLILDVPKNIDYNNLTPILILSMLPLNSTFNHTYTHFVARFCFYNGLKFEEFLSWLKQKHTTMSETIFEKWNKHWKKLDKFPTVCESRIKTLLEFYYPHLKKDIHYRNFVQTFNLPEENKVFIETIDQTCYAGNEKYKVFNVGMGGGKTAQTISYLKYTSSFLWIAPNKALANNTLQRLNQEHIETFDYLAETSKKKADGILNEKNKLIIVLNSLHYLENANYNVVVIDEIETLLDKFLGDFMEQGAKKLKSKIWNTFIRIIRNAKKVVLLDAFITTKTINFIKSIEDADFKIYTRINEPQTRTVVYKNNFEETIAEIIRKIKNGSKVFVFYPYKNGNTNFKSMDAVFELIKCETKTDGIYYNADVDDKIKTGLKNVNDSWGDKKFIITNNIITCGINYENLDIDYKYLFIAPHNTPRDIIQVSYRARYLSTGIINVCYMGKMCGSTTWLDDCNSINCSIYTKLYKDILIEKKAPIRRTFQLFCVQAHYKQKTESKIINQVIQDEVFNLFEKYGFGYDYSHIPDVDFSVVEMLQNKCFAQVATMMDKLSLQKYFFKKQFTDDAENVKYNQNFSFLGNIWDEKYNVLFKQLKYVLSNEDCLFNKIAKLNKLETDLFPENIKKTKLNEEIIEQIFSQFSFKFITKTSSSNKIIKEIYNTYFHSIIIQTNYDPISLNMNYRLHTDANLFYDFAKKYLIIDLESHQTFENLQDKNEENAIEI